MYNRAEEQWDQLADATVDFLEECVRDDSLPTYTQLSNELSARTGQRTFDFDQPSERAAMGYLLWLVVDRTLPRLGAMLSAQVRHIATNDPGPGFYSLATELGLLPKGTTPLQREAFWTSQLALLRAALA